MELFTALRERRTIRRYRQQPVGFDQLLELVDMARRASCGANSQKLRYVTVETPEIVRKLFELTAWGGHVTPRRSPVWGVSAPPSFIAVVAPSLSAAAVQADAGAALQTMELAAFGLGLGCCWIGALKRAEARKVLELPEELEVLYLLAVGYPDEHPVSEDIGIDEPTPYYLDESDRLHVPKIRARDLITRR